LTVVVEIVIKQIDSRRTYGREAAKAYADDKVDDVQRGGKVKTELGPCDEDEECSRATD